MTNITPTLKLKQINKNQTSSSAILKTTTYSKKWL